ncbi:MAG: GMC family oxidoreductase [Deltaproteobacteria bacterium]|nr:GMC family oxidoreductase [Deltaproteobacteria bacterium]
MTGRKLEADVVIAGAGPGGCVLACELARAGKRVVLIERAGRRSPFLGTPLGIYLRLEKRWWGGVRRTEQGDALILARALGGGTVVFAGAAFRPDLDLWRRYGVELSPQMVEQAERECWVHETPPEFIGPGSRRIRQAACELGLPFEVLERHVDFSRCTPGCARCAFGCPVDARWSGGLQAAEAQRCGAMLLTGTTVRRVRIDAGTAVGVEASRSLGRRCEIDARAVVLSAGGIHTARILRRSGISGAGRRLSGDPTLFSFGFVEPGAGNGAEHAMSVGFHDRERGICFCGMAAPPLAWHVQLLRDERMRALRYLHRFGRVLSVFAKVADEGQGEIADDGRVSKTYTARDMDRLAESRETNERILVRAGCRPGEIHHTGLTLGHPGGTLGVGRLLDADLQTEIRGLYCCDTSVLPEATGAPTALTVVVLAKRLADHLARVL